MRSGKVYLTEMVPESSVIWVISLCSIGSIIAVVFSCVCGCRKKTPKNELMGLAGMVKLTNPDENINYNATAPVVQLNSVAFVPGESSLETSEANNKRQPVGVTSATRSLPELPFETNQLPGSGDSLWGNNDHNDTSSDLYATVEDNKIDGRIGNDKKHRNHLVADGSYDSPSQTEDSLSPYAHINSLKREHPYDQLKQNEHPYAQVRANGVPAGIQNFPDRDGSLISTSSQSSVLQDRLGSPVAPPRTRKSLALSQTSIPGLDGCTIPAATAIAGGIPANQELPYMTPPLPNTTTVVNAVPSVSSVGPVNQPQHFSGDSQDSSKGYTSISVREPLSNILGDRAQMRRHEMVDSHYATVSDDSDEMYAAIEEPNQVVYTSGSETYAQIRPGRPALATIEDSEHTTSSSNPISSLRNEHSRQASSSSAASSGVCPNSPKPEKRQANSPLPRPPDPSTSSSSGATGVDDMYAKVIKKRRSSQSISSVDHETEEPTSLGYETLHSSSEPIHDSLIPGYERVSRVSDSVEPNYEELKPQDLQSNCIEACYATVNKNNNALNSASHIEPDYASLSRKDVCSGYDPNYESVCTGSSSDPNYESLEQNDEPPYEKLQSTSDDTSPDYETVYKVDSELYSKVNKHSNKKS